MAGFFNPGNGAKLETLTHAPGAKVLVGLWGGGPNGEMLQVLTSASTYGPFPEKDPAVKLIRSDISSWNFIYEIDTAKATAPIVRALHQGGDYSAPVKLVTGAAPAEGPKGTTAPKGKVETRRKIVDLALHFVRIGSHYLDGTAGNTPGQGDGNAGGNKARAAEMRTSSLDARTTDEPRVLGINMAFQRGRDARGNIFYNTCGGRYAKHSFSPTAKDLETYLTARGEDQKKGLPDRTWPAMDPGKRLYPRKIHYRNTLKPDVVYGESCHGMPHFDCVGLVNYCYARFYKGAVDPKTKQAYPFGMDIVAFENPKSGFVRVDKSPEMDGDVVIKSVPHLHIAMVHLVGTTPFLVQAEDTHLGLTQTAPFVNGEPWRRYRLMDQYLY